MTVAPMPLRTSFGAGNLNKVLTTECGPSAPMRTLPVSVRLVSCWVRSTLILVSFLYIAVAFEERNISVPASHACCESAWSKPILSITKAWVLSPPIVNKPPCGAWMIAPLIVLRTSEVCGSLVMSKTRFVTRPAHCSGSPTLGCSSMRATWWNCFATSCAV